MENGNEKLLMYDLGEGVEAFSTRKNSVLPYHVIQPHQTHSTNVAVIDRPDYTKEELEGIDALVTNLPGVAIGVRNAVREPALTSSTSPIGLAPNAEQVRRQIGTNTAVTERFSINCVRLNGIRKNSAPST